MTALQDQIQRQLGDDFAIERELGGGGMSRVYVAYDRRLDRRVVIKLLRPELSAGVSVDRFRREILTAAALQHPLIVPVLDTGEIDGLPYFLMPFVEGESLRTRLQRGSLGVVDTVRILRDVSRALTVAHARGVVHRDIKPDNVLLANGAAVVADFGVSKAFAEARHGDRDDDADDVATDPFTTAGVSLGTPAYMAPEQVAADPDASYPVDIYAVGVMAYEMLVGAPPFGGRSPQQVMAAHIAEEPVPVQRHRPDIPAALASLIMQCLAKDPLHRPASAATLAQVLDDPQVISGSFTPIPDDGSGSQAIRALTGATAAVPIGMPSKRWRAMFAGVAGVLVAALAWIAGSRDGAAATNDANAARPAMTALDTTPSVAVLPFVYLSADSSQAFAAQAIADAITDALSREKGLRVISRSAADALQKRIAAGDTTRLPVRTLVEGVVETEGDKFRLTVRLVNAADGFTLYADRLEGMKGNLFAMEDEVAGAMRELLRSHFSLQTPDGGGAQ
ncbi:protein kinase domain-containing protein [Gemmatimonas groenlandica]|uniref:Protein kinase n=1 Tax=Gemmatimonas groenlandica TaxID=2732249 RepID=A0A6M4IN08_9BACT|nr:serine/threonine-protein kinase [Gemmatimonas groenlandica]QJR36083.1 protein kinase [Gemmatimonas groenlandica]